MSHKTWQITLFSFISAAGFMLAQTPETPEKPETTDSATPEAFWRAKVPGGEFIVALSHISSVSRHKYLLDGALIVDEVTIDTDGQALARFYVITPVSMPDTPATFAKQAADRGKEIAEQLAARSNVKLQNMVMKKYPDTSHAKSIEYRVMKEAELTSLLTSVETAWYSGKGRKFAIASPDPAK